MRRALLLLPLCASLASAAPPAPLSVSSETLKAFETIEALADAPSPNPEIFLLLADIHTRLKHYPEAAAWLEKAIAGSPHPKPEWRQQLLGLYHESRNFDGCARTLADLIAGEPQQVIYWNQLTGIYQEAGKDLHAIAVRQLMHKNGLLKKPDEIVQLAKVLQYHGLPSRAAELLDNAIKAGGIAASAANLEQQADAWIEARELQKAASALEKTVALAATGDRHHRLGQIYSELKEWPKARQALTQALAHGGLNNPGGAYLLLGLAHYKLNAKDQAHAAFEKARGTPSVRAAAQQWLDHLTK